MSAGFSREANVNSGGPTTCLWIKPFFGFCGELWWVLGFLLGLLGFYRLILGYSERVLCFLKHEKRGEIAVEAWLRVVLCWQEKRRLERGRPWSEFADSSIGSESRRPCVA